MRHLFTLMLLLCAATIASTAHAFEAKELLTFGAGVKWEHPAEANSLIQSKVMWGAMSLKLPLSDHVGALGTFERDLIDQPSYEVKAGVWFRF